MELFFKIAFSSALIFDLGFLVFWLCSRKRLMQKIYGVIMATLDQHYLCGHSIYRMIRTQLFQRFGDFNQEGFCYTISAAIMLSLKDFRQSRIVRGHIKDENYDSNHSWVEVKLGGSWWVIDPCFYRLGFIKRSWYYRKVKPKIMVTYSYKQIWRDPAAHQFYDRLTQPKSSRIFVDLYHYYTPERDGIKIRWLGTPVEELQLPEPGSYYLFSPSHKFKFSQMIINDFMARPTRKSPRRRTLRRLESFYKRKERELAAKTSA